MITQWAYFGTDFADIGLFPLSLLVFMPTFEDLPFFVESINL